MIRPGAAALAVLTALAASGPAAAQQQLPETDDGFTLTPELNLEGADDTGDFLAPAEQDPRPQATTAAGAMLRGLDKLSGELTDLEIDSGQSARFEKLVVTVGECRFPAGNPAGDAYAFLTIREVGEDRPIFEGWMIASSPALNALDHQRYDVWVLRCRTSS